MHNCGYCITMYELLDAAVIVYWLDECRALWGGHEIASNPIKCVSLLM